MTEEEWLTEVRRDQTTIRFIRGLSEETLLTGLSIINKSNVTRDFEQVTGFCLWD